MSYRLRPDSIYRMPTHFGPSLGPRQGEAGQRYACKDTPKTTTVSVSFLTNRDQLEALLPEGFVVGDEPVVTVSASYMKEIEWLAGRGYNLLGVSFPAVFQGTRDRARGKGQGGGGRCSGTPSPRHSTPDTRPTNHGV